MRNHSDQRSNEAKNIILPHDNKKRYCPRTLSVSNIFSVMLLCSLIPKYRP